MKRLNGLEDENARLKKLLTDAMLDNAALKDLLSKKWCAAKREAVAHLRNQVRSERAAGVLGDCGRSHVGSVSLDPTG